MSEQGEAAKIHRSVLLDETLGFLAPRSGGIYVDGTLGLGGHSEAILQKSAPEGRVVAFEWDEAAIEKSRKRLQPFGERLTIIRRNFSEIAEGLVEAGISQVDGILIDIGLSSLQLDIGERGFSFQRDEPLDMRMDTRRKVTAASILAHCSESELADIFYYYGEEKQARRIADFVVHERVQKPLVSSKQLADLVTRAVPRRFHPKKIHVATLVFQALRIAVNTELENLAEILTHAVPFLAPGARFCVISFHSLEDRMVKRKFRDNEAVRVLTKKPIGPGPEERENNPRSRSARLRVVEKI
ncbi:MAG: 16S rRNA (cytosine(1402)-N(4))-methyltransferase RsmH [Proteobacteria bacterium]|nr:16S rRNA (cytosine(1402)-N(4))-methyltransferase RsmH [Pseudomonadota bacterium]MBU1060299.1 16S rRNA (cytosine(1402)-N(4))-methyltransferase RsmH [Pseudomonadota bacterium]